jgi:hypothetical protein
LKPTLAALLLRFKIFCYALLRNFQRRLARLMRALPGCWTVLGIPPREILSVEAWIESESETRIHRAGEIAPTYRSFGSLTRIPRANPAPPGVDGVHLELRHNYLEYRAPFLASIPFAHVLGPHGAIITADGGILVQSTYGSARLRHDRVYSALSLPKSRFLPGSYYTIASLSPAGYYHWMVETLPRLFAFEDLTPRPRLIVNSPLNEWQLESLKLLGFPHQDLIELGADHLQLETLYFPEYTGINPETLRWLRERLFVAIAPESRPRRVYVTRRLAAKRRLLNESEIEPLLEQHGFIIAELETLSFAEQVRLFAQAEIIVGPHGAGLTNMVWAPPGCKVMEVQHPDYVNVMYYMLAEVLQQRYWCCLGIPVGDDSLRHGGTHGHGHVTVPVDLFRKILSEMLEAN